LLLGGSSRGGGREGRADLLAKTHLCGEFYCRARRLDELAHFFEFLENELALDSELFGEFVYSGLSHNSPSWPDPLFLRDRASVVVLQTHREVLIECS